MPIDEGSLVRCSVTGCSRAFQDAERFRFVPGPSMETRSCLFSSRAHHYFDHGSAEAPQDVDQRNVSNFARPLDTNVPTVSAKAGDPGHPLTPIIVDSSIQLTTSASPPALQNRRSSWQFIQVTGERTPAQFIDAGWVEVQVSHPQADS